MGRDYGRSAAVPTNSAAVAKHHSHVRDLTNPKPYKILLEQVTQRKKKLITSVCSLSSAATDACPQPHCLVRDPITPKRLPDIPSLLPAIPNLPSSAKS